MRVHRPQVWEVVDGSLFCATCGRCVGLRLGRYVHLARVYVNTWGLAAWPL